MDNNFVYRELQSGEEENACNMVIECFNEFVAPGYSNEGTTEFYNYVNPVSLRERLKTSGNFALLALDADLIVGVIEVRSYNHISLLFVKKEYHKRGIAKRLLQKAIDICKQANPDIKIIDVNSSPYAVTIYEKMGFIQTDVEQVKNGIRFILMILKLS